MSLFTASQREQLLKNGSNPDKDHKPVVRLFMSNTRCVWLISELYADQPGLAFGLCDLGLGFPELGDCYLPEMEDAEQPDRGIYLICDNTFNSDFPMSVYAAAARAEQQIIVDENKIRQYLPKPST